MANRPLDDKAIDQDAYEQADRQFRLVQSQLPRDAVDDLAREVVLRLAFHLPKINRPKAHPTKAEVAALCQALLSSEEKAGERIILQARADGVEIETIYLGYVAGAARQLGVMWESDAVSFMDVTLASARLYRIIRGLRHAIDNALVKEDDTRRALFALVPDETHTLGIEIATDMFRRAGWDVDLSIGEDQETVLGRTQHHRYESIVLVANSEGMLPNLISLILAMRITQPMAYVIVAGNIVRQVDEVHTLVGADDVMDDIETSVSRLTSIVRRKS